MFLSCFLLSCLTIVSFELSPLTELVVFKRKVEEKKKLEEEKTKMEEETYEQFKIGSLKRQLFVSNCILSLYRNAFLKLKAELIGDSTNCVQTEIGCGAAESSESVVRLPVHNVVVVDGVVDAVAAADFVCDEIAEITDDDEDADDILPVSQNKRKYNDDGDDEDDYLPVSQNKKKC